MSAIQVYVNSKEVKRLIVKRSFDFKIPLRSICIHVGIDYKHFMEQYINAVNDSKFKPTEEQFEAILGFLGIKIRHQFVIDKAFDADKTREFMKSKHDINFIYKNFPHGGGANKKERSISTFKGGDMQAD